MKYVVTVIKVSGARKVLENHEFKGAAQEKDIIKECLNIEKRCRKWYKGDLDISLVQYGECGDGSTYSRTVRAVIL